MGAHCLFCLLRLRYTSGSRQTNLGSYQRRLIMPKCKNCKSHVTEKYVNVFCPPELDRPRVCPRCENMTRDGSQIREKYSYADVDDI